ncbi:hypothetical protein HQQ94_04095 [Shewanella sp. VB17]|uniref:DUF4144 family protein n=1 Tax=Shewanella sp. VB17 TaxID=2739432 RepID=UPI0015656E8E|nr:DUF4144 family protein [Shewanella sp. VB17]NRD72439.1 hypothetical protein [Shewanella sp. VB17]
MKQKHSEASQMNSNKNTSIKNNHTNITWPAILIQPQHDELVYLGSQEAWLIEPQQHLHINTQLFDSLGNTYIMSNNKKVINWEISPQDITLEEIIKKIQYHASLLGHCCTKKLRPKNFTQALNIIRYLEEDS